MYKARNWAKWEGPRFSAQCVDCGDRECFGGAEAASPIGGHGIEQMADALSLVDV
jgi:hypothetical protein